MSDVQDLMLQTAMRFFADQCTPPILEAAEQGQWPAAVWSALDQTGLHLVSIPEKFGGVGGTLADAVTVLRSAGHFAAPLPLAETFLAGWILADAGVALPDIPLTVAISDLATPLQFAQITNQWHVTGTAPQVPYARYCNYVIVFGEALGEGKLGLVELTDQMIAPQTNLAGEPRDTLQFDDTPVSQILSGSISPQAYQTRGALLRTAQMVGALEAILERSVRYASEREQFGRPISKFQAIQQYLAQLAGEVAAAQAALGAAENTGDSIAAIAVAKIRVGEAAGTATRIAHQVHGAMGYTQEYPLHFFSKRLWSWRDEFGSETEWAAWLGRQVAANGADALWQFVAGG